MGRSIARRPVLRALGATLVPVLTTALLTGCSAGGTQRSRDEHLADGSRGTVQLDPTGPFYVGEAIPVSGHTAGIEGREHRLALQTYAAAHRRWSTVATASVRNGGYRFSAPSSPKAGPVKYRTVVYAASGKPLAVSDIVTVQVAALPVATGACEQAPSRATCPRPDPLVEQQTVDVAACPLLTVSSVTQTRTVSWRWDDTTTRWVPDPTPWQAAPGGEQRDAGVADCVRVVGQVPGGAALPDLRIKDLTRCGKGDADATGGTCFTIVPSAPYDEDFPSLEGRKLLKFPVITLNLGAGPVEILADRSGADPDDWEAFQSFYDTHGRLLGSTEDPAVEFYFAGDGHEHWHVRDFDGYELLDATGKEVARAEKHGYCMQDNTSYDPVQGQPRVPEQPVYADATTCGKGLPNALTIIHGLSRGWGDTYPTSLPDQAVDITSLPDGVYTVRVHADVREAVTESNEDNNVATVKIRITGDTVTVVPHSSTGGIP